MKIARLFERKHTADCKRVRPTRAFAFIAVILFSSLGMAQAESNLNLERAVTPKFTNVWSRVFLQPQEKVLNVELVTEGEAVVQDHGYKPDVYIRVSNGSKEYMQSFFTGRIIQLENQSEWYERYATRHEKMVSRESSEIQRFEDASRLSGVELIYDYKKHQEVSLDFYGFSHPPELCTWMAFMRPPLTRVKQEFDFQEPQYYWQKFVIFQKSYLVKQNISPIPEAEEAVDDCNYGYLKGKHFHTEVSNSDVLLLGDGTMLVSGQRFVARIKLKDGKMGVASKYLKVIDAVDFFNYLRKLNHYYEKNDSRADLRVASPQEFNRKYSEFADDLVHHAWF